MNKMGFTNCLFCYEKNTTRRTITADIENENKGDLILIINSLPSLLDISQYSYLQFNQTFFGFNQLDFICNKCQILIEDGGKILEKIKKLQEEFEQLKCEFKKTIEKNAKLEFKIGKNIEDPYYLRNIAGEKGREIILNELGYLKDEIFQDNFNELDPGKAAEDGELTVYNNDDDDFELEENEEESNSLFKIEFFSPSPESLQIKEEFLQQDPLQIDTNEEELKEDIVDTDTFQRRSLRSCSQREKIKNGMNVNKKKVNRPKKISFNFPKDEDWTFCIPCQKPFKSQRHYFSHKFKIHGGPKYFKCSRCYELFGTLAKLDEHRFKVHYGNKGKFPCNLCEKVLKSKQCLQIHFSRSHSKTPREKIKCKFCDKSYIDLQNLKKHEECHSNPLTCLFCGKQYILQKELKGHIKKCHKKKPKIV